MENQNTKYPNTTLLKLIAAAVVLLILISLLRDSSGVVSGFIDALK